jgi:hypothetical protein
MKRIAALILFAASVANAQTIAPITSEYGKKANGSFQIQNNTLLPLTVTVESYSVTLDKSGRQLHPLLSTSHVRLSQTSARLGPKEIYEFSYHIACDTLPTPCLVTFLSGMIVGHTQGDKDHPVMQVRVILDHAVYICAKEKNCRADVIKASGYQSIQHADSMATPK